ncbi:hypothetical protein [Streptomyces sp. NPDC002078]
MLYSAVVLGPAQHDGEDCSRLGVIEPLAQLAQVVDQLGARFGTGRGPHVLGCRRQGWHPGLQRGQAEAEQVGPVAVDRGPTDPARAATA